MYRNFYGLSNNPFGLSPDPRFLFLTPAVRETLACLQHCVRRRSGFLVLTGEVGTGKSTLLRVLMDYLERQRLPFSFVFNPRLSVEQFLDYVLADLDIACETRTKGHMLMCLNEWLLERYRCGETTALIVDEAHLLSDSLLEEIRLLTNLESGQEKLLQIILAGQPELKTKLAQNHLRQVRQRIFLHCTLPMLTREQTFNYVRHRLSQAGANGKAIFSEEALEVIHRYSLGVPRVINTLCEHALIHGYVSGLRPIGHTTISGIAQEFELTAEGCDQPVPSSFPGRGERS